MDIGGSLRVMAVCRIQYVENGETDRQLLLTKIPNTLHQALHGYLDSKGARSFNYALFDVVFDVRALEIDVASLLEKGQFENPLTVVQPGPNKISESGAGHCASPLRFLR